MADDKKTTSAEQNAQRPPESSASPDADRYKATDPDDVKLPTPRLGVVGEALVGDEAVREAGTRPEAEVVQEDQPAQKMPKERFSADADDSVPVHETYVQMDRVILDPSSPEAVQIPDAGIGFLDLPIHALADGTPEEKFEAGENDEEARTLPGTRPDNE